MIPDHGAATLVVLENVPLVPLTTLAVGGAARWYLRADSIDRVQAAHRWSADRSLPVFILGGGSNIVVADEGVAGLVLHVAVSGIDVRVEGDEAVFDVGAGEPWDPLVSRIVDGGYAGVECLSGIPGFTGGTPIQNVGAYGQEVADTIESVTAIDCQSGDLVSIPNGGCGFGYRQSRFKQADAGRFVVCRVQLRVRRGAPTVTYPDVIAWIEQHRHAHPTARHVRQAVLEIRRRKGMVLDPADADTRSVGSFFTNPIVPVATQQRLGAPAFPVRDDRVKIPAAWLIERAGFTKGFAAGAVGLSTKHPLAIVNRGGARAADVVEFACRIKRAVLDRHGVALRPEPVFVGFGNDERVDFLLKDSD